MYICIVYIYTIKTKTKTTRRIMLLRLVKMNLAFLKY